MLSVNPKLRTLPSCRLPAADAVSEALSPIKIRMARILFGMTAPPCRLREIHTSLTMDSTKRSLLFADNLRVPFVHNCHLFKKIPPGKVHRRSIPHHVARKCDAAEVVLI